jgi:hypothetical protein
VRWVAKLLGPVGPVCATFKAAISGRDAGLQVPDPVEPPEMDPSSFFRER